MGEQSEIDGTLLNPVSLTDLIKAQTKRKKGWLHQRRLFFFCVFLFIMLSFLSGLESRINGVSELINPSH